MVNTYAEFYNIGISNGIRWQLDCIEALSDNFCKKKVKIKENKNQMQHFIIANLNLFPSKVVKWLPRGPLFICICLVFCCSVLFADH